jgi:aminoglycoside 6'-N-acetyltransferase I
MLARMQVRPFQPSDRDEARRVVQALFTDAPAGEAAEIAARAATGGTGFFVLARPDGGLAGFLEVATRAYAEGCDSSPVAYIEGWYVDADVRRQGWGRALFRAAEAWARQRGLSEIASDSRIDNAGSIAAHRALGYEEVERIVCFKKAL